MNIRATITLLVFLGWGAASTWWYTCKIKGTCAQEEPETYAVITAPTTEAETEKASAPTTTTTPDTATSKPAVVETLKSVLILFSSGSVEQEKNKEIDDYLKSLAAQLKTSGKKITIVGHTDNTGDEKSNDRLGKQRAESVKSSLVTLGADPGNIQCISKGETQPAAPNDTDEGKRQNRRVEILFN